jgi:hypothetical protein
MKAARLQNTNTDIINISLTVTNQASIQLGSDEKLSEQQ